MDLILKMLAFNPGHRLTAGEILKHPFVNGKRLKIKKGAKKLNEKQPSSPTSGERPL
jgi:serine/threonine protein kinase